MSLPTYRPPGLRRDNRASRVVIAQSDVDGGIQCEHASGDVDQLDGTDFYEPPGLAVTPASTTEALRVPGDPDPMAFPRGTRHSSTPTPPDGGAVLYGPAGGYVYVAANGDVIQEPKSGQLIKLGNTASKPLALHQDLVGYTAAFKVWIDAVTAITGVPALVGSSIGWVSATASKVVGE